MEWTNTKSSYNSLVFLSFKDDKMDGTVNEGSSEEP